MATSLKKYPEALHAEFAKIDLNEDNGSAPPKVTPPTGVIPGQRLQARTQPTRTTHVGARKRSQLHRDKLDAATIHNINLHDVLLLFDDFSNRSFKKLRIVDLNKNKNYMATRFTDNPTNPQQWWRWHEDLSWWAGPATLEQFNKNEIYGNAQLYLEPFTVEDQLIEDVPPPVQTNLLQISPINFKEGDQVTIAQVAGISETEKWKIFSIDEKFDGADATKVIVWLANERWQLVRCETEVGGDGQWKMTYKLEKDGLREPESVSLYLQNRNDMEVATSAPRATQRSSTKRASQSVQKKPLKISPKRNFNVRDKVTIAQVEGINETDEWTISQILTKEDIFQPLKVRILLEHDGLRSVACELDYSGCTMVSKEGQDMYANPLPVSLSLV